MSAGDDPPDEEHAPALDALLRWYVAMGVDAALDDAPHDRFVDPAPPESRSAPAIPAAPTMRAEGRPMVAAGAPQPAETLVAQAEALAAGIDDIEVLRAQWETVPGCTLNAASRMIHPSLSPGAPLMLVGGTPGEDDERSGAIFAGPSGRLLDAMLRAIGLSRSDVTLSHVVPWRPPGNRAPTPLELALCLPFARRLIALAKPKLLLCLGERAAQPLLGTRDSVNRLRGRWLEYEGDGATVKTLVSFAPDFLLKQSLQKRRAWADLLMVEDALDPSPKRTMTGRSQVE